MDSLSGLPNWFGDPSTPNFQGVATDVRRLNKQEQEYLHNSLNAKAYKITVTDVIQKIR